MSARGSQRMLNGGTSRSFSVDTMSQEKENTRFKNSSGCQRLKPTSELSVHDLSDISNPDTRHCLYGLDADLIMLGLLSHDPHFCLLREEVTFGRKTKKSSGLANANFYLLHISLLREYLNLEFISLKEQIPFEYDLERIIDDFILMGIFVGNDFLPHLPDLHINEGALERIWTIYKSILPTAGRSTLKV